MSRLIPGSFADRYAENSESFGKSPDRVDYLRQLEASGTGKPLFYFSLRTLAQPDTIERVFPVAHQQFLQDLAGRYGNWPPVAAYYQSLMRFQEAANAAFANDTIAAIDEPLALLFQITSPEAIKLNLRLIRKYQAINHRNFNSSLAALESRFNEMVQEAKPYYNLLPGIKWNGLNNQYHTWLKEIVRGDLGNSPRDEQPVLDILQQAIGNTLLLLAVSLVLVFFLAIELSLALTGKKNWWRRILLPLLYVFESVPLFITALLLLVLFTGSGYVVMASGPEAETGNWFTVFSEQVAHLALPALCLILASLPYVTTQLFQATQQVLATDYIKTARAKGLSETQVVRRHAFRNTLLPLITLFTGYLPSLISGAVVLEVIFAIPGTGRLLVDSVLARDYPVVLGLVLFIATLKVGSHLLADFLYFTADPRTRQKVS
jgi:peptide/nickel transport system permease protein